MRIVTLPKAPVLALALLLSAALALPGTAAASGPQHGKALISKFGCGACHSIPGVEGADGLVGPPLTHMGSRVFLAGVLRNTPDNMVTWLRHPQSVVPGNAMPDVGLTERQARAITAYLQSLK